MPSSRLRCPQCLPFTGPSSWAELWPVCCAGYNQSPIDLNPGTAKLLNVSSLLFHGFSADDIPRPSAMDLINNGHTGMYNLVLLHKTILLSKNAAREHSLGVLDEICNAC